MIDAMEKPTSSLAIVENKPQRPGGCVGIFFQLFDWNRRLAKNKLFSKKLLPPVRFKQGSKKFGGDEKQPKLRLIADENNGGFPTAKNSNGTSVDNEKHEMRVPGLVARLMGLESIPALQRDKSKKKSSASGIGSGKAERLVEKKEELNVEKGGVKNEVRPQKLQKTSVCERQPITGFGAEKLPFKNVLSKSRKPHRAKLPSPLKSPKNLSRKRPSKLIGAATRILEPGLQTSRSRCALPSSNSIRHPPRGVDAEERMNSSSSHLQDCNGFGSVAAEGESSCRNCGYLMDDLNGEHTVPSQPLVFASHFSNHARSSCQFSCKPVNAAFCHQMEEEFTDDYQAVAGPVIGNGQSHVKFASYRSPFCTGQIQRHFCSQPSKPPRGMEHKPYRHNRMFQAREMVPPPRPNTNALMNSKAATVMNGTKNYVSVNQSLSCSSRLRVPARVESGRFELEKRINRSMNESVPTGRKRRPTNISRQGENLGCSSFSINRPINGPPHSVAGKQLGYNTHYNNHESDKVGFLCWQDRTFESSPANSNVVSFAFNSSVKQKIGIHEVRETQVRRGLYCDGGGEEAVLGESGGKIERPCSISGDALGALLEQKLKELNCQGEDTGNAPKKTTTTILQELILALTLEAPIQQDGLPAISDRINDWSNHSHLPNSKPSAGPQSNAMGVKLPFDQPLDSEHSPGSVLDPFFSTEGCPSSSADDSLGYCETESPNHLSDSAASLNRTDNTKRMIADIRNNVSEILCCSGLAFGLKQNELDQVENVLLNAELVLRGAMLSGSAVGRGSPIKHLLLDELDMLASILWMNFGCSLGIEDGKEVDKLRRFVLDSVMEYLGLRFQEYHENGIKVSRKLPLRMNNSMLILEIVELVRRWEKISRLGVDELVEKEMGLSLGEWTVCESEAFESGVEISRDLLQILVDEIVMDFCKWQS